MSTPQWIKVDGPPPGPPPRAPRTPRAPKPAAWAPPTTAPVSLAPPVIKKPYEGIAVTRSEYTCLPREGSADLTACGRLLVLEAITVSDDPTQVNCPFCQMRLRMVTVNA